MQGHLSPGTAYGNMPETLHPELGTRTRGGLLSSSPPAGPRVLRWAIQRDGKTPTEHEVFHYPTMEGAQLSVN